MHTSYLNWPCLKIGKGHPNVMFYKDFVEHDLMMFHAKFQIHKPSGFWRRRFLLCIALAAILVMWFGSFI